MARISSFVVSRQLAFIMVKDVVLLVSLQATDQLVHALFPGKPGKGRRLPCVYGITNRDNMKYEMSASAGRVQINVSRYR